MKMNRIPPAATRVDVCLTESPDLVEWLLQDLEGCSSAHSIFERSCEGMGTRTYIITLNCEQVAQKGFSLHSFTQLPVPSKRLQRQHQNCSPVGTGEDDIDVVTLPFIYEDCLASPLRMDASFNFNLGFLTRVEVK